MRRFELSDGSSNKFWQVSLQDETTLRVSFGKIGQKGQTQLKKFASASAAAAEMEKLIREKTKKGYVEVAADDVGATRQSAARAAAAAAPSDAKGTATTPSDAKSAATTPSDAKGTATAPSDAKSTPTTPSDAKSTPTTSDVASPTVDPPVFEERFVWTEAAKKLADGAFAPGREPLPSPEDAATAIAAAANDTLRPTSFHETTAPLRERVVALFSDPALVRTIDPDVEAAAATMTRSGALRPAFLARWIAIGGIEAALEVLSRMWAYRRTADFVAFGQQERSIALVDPATSWDSSVCSAKSDITELLAVAIRRAPEAERTRARARAGELRSGAPLPVRIGLARALDDARFAAADAEEVLALPRNAYPHDAKVLMRLVDDVTLLEGLVDRFGFDYSAFRPEIVVRRVGVPAAKLIGRCLAKAGSRPYEIDVATYLATLECADAARVLGEWLDTKGVDAIAKEYFGRRPDLAFPVLGAMLAGRGKAALFAEPVAKSLLAKHAQTFDAVAPRLEPKALAAFRDLGVTTPAQEEPEEARPSDLPRVLVSPPWLSTKKAAAPPVIEDITPLAFTERVVLEEAERETYGKPEVSSVTVRGWYRVPPALEPRTPAMDDVVREKMYTCYAYLASWLDLMSDARVRRYMTEELEIAARGLAVTISDLRYLLVRFGLDALPFILTVGRGDAPTVAEALLVVDSPRVALFMADAAVRSKKAKPHALRYLARHAEASAIALLPAALAKKSQKVAVPALQLLASKHEAVVRDVAARYGAEVEGALDALLAWEGAMPKPPPMPSWFSADKLPPVLLRESEQRLPSSAVASLGALLAISAPRQPHDHLEEVKEACTPDSLARFAWGLFQTWLSEGANGKEDWAMTALGHLAGDDAARRLAPLIRAWPGESAHARAVKGLDVLAQIGSDLALMLLDSIAEKVKFKGLQERAREKIEEVAEERGLSREQLADRIAPTLDLDPDGSRVLSFGPRSFRVGFDENLVPFVLDDAGKRAADLPKPRASDDAAQAAEATQLWKTLKKDAKTVAASQISRLERAMCSQRKWTGADFRSLLVDHPLVFHLVRRLLWATYSGGAIERLFRVAEDRSLANDDDETFVLADDATVGLPHRLELDTAPLRRWGEVFASYEILQPFPQLEREIFEATADERNATALARTAGLSVPTRKVIGLTARGWQKGAPQDAGWIWDMKKVLPGGLVALLPLEGGLIASAMAESPETQTLGDVTVLRGDEWRGDRVPLGTMPALVFSELVRDLEALRD